MSEEKKPGIFKRFCKAFLFSPVNMIFAVATAFCAAKAYMWEPSLPNRLIFFGVAGLWAFWIIARYMVVLFVIAALLCGGYYAYYQYSTREIRQCEKSGGEWNKETKTCDAKLSVMDKVTNQIRKFFGIEKTEEAPTPKVEIPATSNSSQEAEKALNGALNQISNILLSGNNNNQENEKISKKANFEEDND